MIQGFVPFWFLWQLYPVLLKRCIRENADFHLLPQRIITFGALSIAPNVKAIPGLQTSQNSVLVYFYQLYHSKKW